MNGEISKQGNRAGSPAALLESGERPPVPAEGISRPAQVAAEPPLDRDLLIRRCLGRLDLVDRLLKSFESRFPEDLFQIEECLRENDSERLSRLVHQAKGATANVSAADLHANISRLEHAVKSQQHEVANSCLADVHRAWNRFVEFKAATNALPPHPHRSL